jgi:RimJ/RimL family protein N-acetyltransferase
VFSKDSLLKKQLRRIALLLCLFAAFPSEAALSCKNILGSIKYFFLKVGKSTNEQAFLEMNRIKEYPFQGERLIFKKLDMADIHQAEEILGGSKESYFGNKTLSQTEIFSSAIFNIINVASNSFVRYSRDSRGASNELAFYSRRDNKLVGLLGAHFNFLNQEIYLSYVVDKSLRNQGYASEALINIIHEIQRRLGGQLIFMANVYEDNFSSIKVLEKAGFEFVSNDEPLANVRLYRKVVGF